MSAAARAVPHLPGASVLVCPAGSSEFEIDIDQEPGELAQRSGVAYASGHATAPMLAFVAWIATLCAEIADAGGGRVAMVKAAAVASRHHPRAWRSFACLLARHCATLALSYGVNDGGRPSGEVIRWLFADEDELDARSMH